MRKPLVTSLVCLLLGVLIIGCASATPTPSVSQVTPLPIAVKTGEVPQICADGGALAMVWEDTNGNGQQDQGESPMANVCVLVQKFGNAVDENTAKKMCASSSNLTAEDGRWSSDILFGSCGSPSDVSREMENQCNNLSMLVFPPTGYKTTTAETVKGCRARFGLTRTSATK
jgi:hypothetical protein